MSLHEPSRLTPNDYVHQVLDQLQREIARSGHPSASFVAMRDRASIPRDLRRQLLGGLVTGRYVPRAGDEVGITKTGQQLAAAAQGHPVGCQKLSFGFIAPKIAGATPCCGTRPLLMP